MEKINFLLILHNHQPCDNFGWVFEDAYKKSYEPFIGALEKYPKVKVLMHYSGSLLEWMLKHRPEFIIRIKSLIKRRQLALLSGGFYEPILPTIPDRDKIGQIKLLTDFIKNHFEYNPKGLWIAERVWEGPLSLICSSLGLEYTIVDENHLLRSGIPKQDIYGYFELDNGFKVFAASKLLRYIIPFASIKELIKHFTKLSRETDITSIVFADDGEKFGFWPHTYDWVYKRKWLERFFDYLSDDSSILKPVLADEIFQRHKPAGKVNIPPSSYSEMMEWAGGDFNNFFKIYPEANIMRNRMLQVSEAIEKVNRRASATSKESSLLESAKMELYKAQSGCAYWHGIFGGLYLGHLRSSVYKHLINAQNILEELSNRSSLYLEMLDLDNDTNQEVILGNKFFNLYIKPTGCGSVFELDNKGKSLNMVNIITRRYEKYHSKLFGKKHHDVKNIKSDLQNNRYMDIHQILGVRDAGLKKHLIYDESKKESIVEYFFADRMRLKDFSKGHCKNLMRLSKGLSKINKRIDKDFISFILEKEGEIKSDRETFNVYIKKEFTISNGSEFYLEYTLKNLSKSLFSTTFAIEFNWSFMNKNFLKKKDIKRIDRFSLRDEWSDAKLEYSFSESVRLWTLPIYTINETETGLAKTYQYLSLVIQKPINLESEESTEFSLTITIE